jgi:3-dehydroquinate dehydratase-2
MRAKVNHQAIHARDELHRHSKLSAAATSVICGMGPYGYIGAMQAATRLVAKLPDALPAPIRIGPR